MQRHIKVGGERRPMIGTGIKKLCTSTSHSDVYFRSDRPKSEGSSRAEICGKGAGKVRARLDTPAFGGAVFQCRRASKTTPKATRPLALEHVSEFGPKSSDRRILHTEREAF